MTTYLDKLLTDSDEITVELRSRTKTVIEKTVRHADKDILAEKVRVEMKDGWEVAKENKQSTRMKKAKPIDEQLEDLLWSILARMGFYEMSYGRLFTIHVGTNVNPRQIDVFAGMQKFLILSSCN